MRLSRAVAGVVAAAAVGGALAPVATAAPAPAGTLIDFPKHKHLYPYKDPRREGRLPDGDDQPSARRL
jgi:uncharacterized protein with LGFP repeats